ncbi:MAG TPA: glutathione binding-like protein [Polyangiaceae bacterium]|jgi:glutathione S-transferase
MIKLYGNPYSTCTRKVLTVLEETHTPFEMNVVDLGKGEHKQKPNLERQPFGQIPAIDDDGFAMFESRAIARYLAGKAESPLLPKNPQTRATMEQWISVEQSNFSPNAMKFIYQWTFNRPQEQSVLDAAGGMLEKTFTAISAPLATSAYLAGDTFSIADIAYMPYVEYLMKAPPAKAIFEKHPNVVNWWTRVSERPSWRKVAGRAS